MIALKDNLPLSRARIINYFIVFTALYFIILLAAKFSGLKIVIVLIPVLALAAAVIISITGLRWLFVLSFFCLPFSVNVDIFDSGINLIVPSEPIAAVVVIALMIRILFKNPIPPPLLTHPITILVFLYIFVLLVTVGFSSMILVSMKAAAVRLCYILFYFLLGAVLFWQDITIGKKAMAMYGISLSLIVLYVLLNHYAYDFSKDVSGGMVKPFFADHTIYSACIAMILPFFIYFGFFRSKLHHDFIFTLVFATLAIIFCTGLFMGYSRAAWLSVIIAVVIFVLIYYGVKMRFFVFSVLVMLTLFFIYDEKVYDAMKQNKSDSNARNAGIEQQTKSVTNITTDQSNAERLNRWVCALRMFNDRPFTGYGVGTYQFQYLPYQHAKEMTRISVVTPYNYETGHGGTAHSEPLLALSETGIFSIMIQAILIMLVIYYGIKNYRLKNEQSVYCLVTLTGFITYLVHSFFNNFLDTDKAAGLFWFAIATIMVIDIKNSKNIKASGFTSKL